jgi:hypothetical protein
MGYQIVMKPIGLIYDLKLLVHGILYSVTFMHNSVLDSTYSMFNFNTTLVTGC